MMTACWGSAVGAGAGAAAVPGSLRGRGSGGRCGRRAGEQERGAERQRQGPAAVRLQHGSSYKGEKPARRRDSSRGRTGGRASYPARVGPL